MTKISDLTPVREKDNLIIVPTFLTGKLKDAVLPPYQELIKDNSSFQFVDTDKETARGSNVFIAGGLNYVLKDSKFRTAVPTDNIYETIFPMIKDNFYSDLNALDVREKKPENKKNGDLWKKIVELAEEKQGSMKFPFRIQGFYCVPDANEKNYGASLVPAKNFQIIQDERLNLLTGTKFSTLDTNGMINPDKNGNFTWYALDNGLSGVYLLRSGYLDSVGVGLAYSVDFGRVVLLDAEGVAPKFSAEKYTKEIQEAYDKKISSAVKIRDKALSDLEKL